MLGKVNTTASMPKNSGFLFLFCFGGFFLVFLGGGLFCFLVIPVHVEVPGLGIKPVL